MKKLMFSDRCGLTRAVLEGRKTMTRRLVPIGLLKKADSEEDALLELSPFKVGEVVAVAQSLRDMGYDPRDTKHKSGAIWGLDHTPAWTNKMFVSASECIHQIRITGIRVERLQDISDEDCLREGIIGDKQALLYGFRNGKHYETYFSPRKAFADLINKTSGKGTWDSNPFCFCYAFELIK